MTLFCKGRNGAEARETSCLEIAKWKPVAATFLMNVVHASSFMFLFLQWMAKAGLSPFKPFQVSGMLCVRRESSESLLWLPRCTQENASLQPSQKERYACIELVTGSWSVGCLFVFMAFQSWRCLAAQEEEVRGGQGIA